MQPVHSIVGFERPLPEQSIDPKSGIVDQQFQARLGSDAFGHPGDIGFKRQVGNQDLGARSVSGSDLRCDGVQLFPPPGDQEQIVGGSEFPGESFSDSARCACDDG